MSSEEEEGSEYSYGYQEEEEEDEEEDVLWIDSLIEETNGFLLRVPAEFIESWFNSQNLPIPRDKFDPARSLLLRGHASDRQRSPVVELYAIRLFLIYHQRYIRERVGLREMFGPVADAKYGRCPRVCCQDAPLIPTGSSNVFGTSKVMLYCPCCRDLYHPADETLACLDGAAFGVGYGEFLYAHFQEELESEMAPRRVFSPNIYGFGLDPRLCRLPRFSAL